MKKLLNFWSKKAIKIKFTLKITRDTSHWIMLFVKVISKFYTKDSNQWSNEMKWWLCFLGQANIVELLIKSGSDVNNEEYWVISDPLGNAAANGNEISTLHQLEQRLNRMKWKWNSFLGDVKIVELLINGGADIYSINKWGMTPQEIAKKKGKIFESYILIWFRNK